MRDLLFLCHRIPYPPDKGDKIRAWHVLRHLAARGWRIRLGCLVDDPADMAHLPVLRETCAEVAAFPFSPRVRRLRSLARLRPGRPLSLDYFYDARLARWVAEVRRRRAVDAAYVFCSAMAPYLARADIPRRVLDLVDIDSEKWAAYAERARWPGRLVWAREARTLLAFERQAVLDYDHALLVSEEERLRFAELAPESMGRVFAVENGVDTEFFAPRPDFPRPFGPEPAIVFTGTMDYRPNVEAVAIFARRILPALRHSHPDATFHIVGANPAPEVQRLAALPGVFVTGRVADTRPYMAHAALTVAPLRIARGIQNKVLEAMAMARPVLATPQAFEGVRAVPGRDLLVAEDDDTMARLAAEVLDGRHAALGAAAREAVRRGHDWSATLRRVDALLDPVATRMANPEPAGAHA